MYQGSTERRPAEWSATAYPVKKLMEPYSMGVSGRGVNRVMCLDNWYTSIEVAVFLMLTYKVYLIGTIKTNRKGLPKEHIYPKIGRGKKVRGTMSTVMATISGVIVYFTSWMDSKPVHGLSTLPTDKDTVQRKDKDADGRFAPTTIWRPTMWQYYNKGMGGTDLHDQLNQYYRTMVRCKKWPIRIFTHFLHSVVTNAYILYREKNELKTSDFSLLEFIDILLDNIHALPDSDAPEDDIDVHDPHDRSYTTCAGWAKPANKNARLSTPKTSLHYTANDKKSRGRCPVCKKNGVYTRCALCPTMPFLCNEGFGLDNCFYRFHTLDEFSK